MSLFFGFAKHLDFSVTILYHLTDVRSSLAHLCTRTHNCHAVEMMMMTTQKACLYEGNIKNINLLMFFAC